MKSESCVVYDLSAFRIKREFEQLSSMISSIVCDRENLPYSIELIKKTILKSRTNK